MPLYEHIFLIRPEATQEEVNKIRDNYKAVIEANGGSVPKVEDWGLRTIAYKIQKSRKAYYTLLNIDAPAKALQELERQMNLSEDVLRFFTVKVDELEEGPSAIILRKEKEDRKRKEREELGEGYGFEVKD